MAALSPANAQDTAPIAPNRPRWSAIYAMTMCVVVLIASEFMPASLLSPIANDLMLTAGQAGQAISISGFFAVVASLLVTTAIGTLDRRVVLVSMALVLAVSGALVALAPNFFVLMTGRALLGIAVGGFWSLNTAMTMRLLPASLVPLGLAISNGGTAFAWTVAPPLSSYMGAVIGWRATFFCVVPLALAAAVWQALALPRLLATGTSQGGGLLRVLRNRQGILGLAASGAFFMGQFGLQTYLRPFLERITHVDAVSLSALLLVIGIAGLAGTFVISRAVRASLPATLVGIPVIMAGIAVGLALAGGSFWAVTLLLAGWGLVATPAPIAWGTWITRALPNDAEAGGALWAAVVQTVITIGAAGGGLVLDNFGARAEFASCAAVLAAAALLALAVGRAMRPSGVNTHSAIHP